MTDGIYCLIREVRITGCVMEDEADTRVYKTSYYLIPITQMEQYGLDIVSEYESQDYSYQFESEEIAKLRFEDIVAIFNEVTKLRKDSDFEQAFKYHLGHMNKD